MSHDAILSLSCADRPGIVAAVSARVFEAGCNITEAHQYNDPDTALFFMRVRFAVPADVATEAIAAFPCLCRAARTLDEGRAIQSVRAWRCAPTKRHPNSSG